MSAPLRAVRSEETCSVRRQVNGQVEQEHASWVWVTTLSPAQASTELVVRLGHVCWDIENQGFNELVNGWHTDHIYRHHANASEAFTLLAFLAYNLFHALLTLNLKPQLRESQTESFWTHLIAAEIYAQAGTRVMARAP